MLAALGTRPDGLTPAEANRRRAEYSPNAVRIHHARALGVLGHQLRSALLVLLLVTAVVSYVLGERTEALIARTRTCRPRTSRWATSSSWKSNAAGGT